MNNVLRHIHGRPFKPDAPPQRVVSLVPSLTETLADLGATQSLAGITDFCIFPPGLVAPRVGGTKNPRVEQIRALRPDVVYMNLEENLKPHAEAIGQFAVVAVSEPKTVDDVVELIAALGDIHGRPARATELRSELTAARSSLALRRFTFACAIWKEPWMWCGGDTYVSSLVAEAGGINVIAGRQRYPTLALDEIATLKPDIVFLPDEPYVFTPEDAAFVREKSDAKVIGPFPGHLFTWHGTRTILGLRFLESVLDDA